MATKLKIVPLNESPMPNSNESSKLKNSTPTHGQPTHGQPTHGFCLREAALKKAKLNELVEKISDDKKRLDGYIAISIGNSIMTS